jgi:hypothetical protein
MAAGTPVDVQLADRADDRTLTALADRVAGAVVGCRLMLAGPEVDVLAARAVAVAGGALDAELRIAVTGGQHRRGQAAGRRRSRRDGWAPGPKRPSREEGCPSGRLQGEGRRTPCWPDGSARDGRAHGRLTGAGVAGTAGNRDLARL